MGLLDAGTSQPSRAEKAVAEALALCMGTHPTSEWCSTMDELVVRRFAGQVQALGEIADAIRLKFLTGQWDFASADHAINMLAGWAQRAGVTHEGYWATYLVFDGREVEDHSSVDERRVRAELARPGDRVVSDHARRSPSDFDGWGAGEGVGCVVVPSVPLHDLGMVDVRWPQGRCVEDVAGLRWLVDEVL